ncbi:MAG: adenylate/guanylate cyclase domain-containing protein [Alphaproteobacteria bacterium 13_2_20CM_2_64_7]|jgi:adenylate cyclase|nr:MAG: adenylate/guanylate cyclase domain-containing protein [Alphaproteobacteria bacterium 13_2_20CM_2_64_7]
MERRLAAIFAADVAGYSRLIGADEEGTLARLKAHRRELIDPTIAEHQGRIVKTTGDGVLAEFASPVKAVRCAIDVQYGMAERNAGVPEGQRIEFRIGINLGDVVVEDDGDLYGDGVNVAARLENIAEPGAVYISRTVRDFVDGTPELVLEDLGERELKNIARLVQVFRIAPPQAVGAAQAGPPAVPHKPSIAVLPFTNMSGDAEQEYFSDGISEDLITDLSKISGLFIIARNSTFAYKGRSVKVQEIGRDLGVRFVLEGSIRKAGNRVRITAQLIDAGSGGHLWAERFDRELTDIFATQDEVVEKIVAALAVNLTQGEAQRLRRRGTASVEAYETWLRARELLSRSMREAIAQAKAMYRRAIEIDPNFAAPHAGLSLATISEYVSDWAADPEEALDEAERWARRALELDDQEPVSHMALGNVMLWRRNHEGALAEFGRMIALDPNFAQGHSATGLALMYAGRAAEALEAFAIAKRLDPHSPSIVLHFVAQANFSLGRYEAAAEHLLERIARTPATDSSRMLLAACYGHRSRVDEARAAWAGLMKVNPDFSLAQRARVLPYKEPRDFQRIAEGLAKAGLP